MFGIWSMGLWRGPSIKCKKHRYLFWGAVTSTPPWEINQPPADELTRWVTTSKGPVKDFMIDPLLENISERRQEQYCLCRGCFFCCLLWRSAFSLPATCTLEWQGGHFVEYTLPFWKPKRSSMSSEFGLINFARACRLQPNRSSLMNYTWTYT